MSPAAAVGSGSWSPTIPSRATSCRPATRAAGATDFGPVQTLAGGLHRSVVAASRRRGHGRLGEQHDDVGDHARAGRGQLPSAAVRLDRTGRRCCRPSEAHRRRCGERVDVGRRSRQATGTQTCWTARRDAESRAWSAPKTFASGPSFNNCVIEAAPDGTLTYALGIEDDTGGGGEQLWVATRSPDGMLGHIVLDRRLTGGARAPRAHRQRRRRDGAELDEDRSRRSRPPGGPAARDRRCVRSPATASRG